MRESTLNSALWLVGSNILRLSIALALIPILTRLLSPEDYGLFNFVFPIILALVGVADLGYSTTLVRSSTADSTQDTTVMLLSIVGGILIFALLIIGSEYIGSASGYHNAGFLLKECSFLIILGALCAAPFARLQRESRMRGFAIGDVLGALVGGGVAIIAAWNGAGVHSLVLQQAISTLVRFSIALKVGKFSLSSHVDGFFIKSNFRFSVFALGSNVSVLISKSIDAILIGYILGFYNLGLYGIAMQVVRIPESIVVGPIYAALLPAFSRASRSAETFTKQYLSAIFIVISFCLSILLGIGLVARDLVDVLLGDKWDGSTPIIKILVIYAAGSCVFIVQQAVLIGSGRSGLCFKISSFGTFTLVIMILVGSRWGILGVALGVSVSSVVAALVSVAAVCRLHSISVILVIWQARVPLIAAAAMAAVIQSLQIYLKTESPILPLILLSLTGGITFISVYMAMGGHRHLREALDNFSRTEISDTENKKILVFNEENSSKVVL
jgi:O-antigen/teichoic acid export membrane protein